MIGITEIGAHLRGFFQCLVDFVFHADAAQLIAQVGNHAAGDLMDVLSVVVFGRFADGKILLSRAGGEMLGHAWRSGVFVDHRLVTQRARVHGDIKDDGFDEPSASGGIAVLMWIMPALIASRQQSVPSPVVQCVCNSTVLPPAAFSTAGTTVLVRSGVRMPPGSLKMTR